MNTLQNILDDIRTKKWELIRGKWLEFMPEIDPAGTPPDEIVSSSYTFSEAIENKKDTIFRIDKTELRKLVFWEATYLLHKSSHVLGVAENNASMGACTWSLSNAYQSSYFSSKIIMMLCGVYIAEYKNKNYICDLWPEPENLQNTKKNKGEIDGDQILVIKTNIILDHKSIWMILQRLLRILKIEIWPKHYMKVLKNMNLSDFSKQRNILHYNNNRWIMDDMFEFKAEKFFGKIPDNFSTYFRESYKNSDFSIVLSNILFDLALRLFFDVSDNTNLLGKEVDLIKETINNMHPNFELSI